MNKKVAVIGGLGFIGKHVVENLKQNGFDVITLGRSTKNDVYFDLSKRKSIITALTNYKTDFIVHLASPSLKRLYRYPKVKSDKDINKTICAEINGSYTIFATAKKLGVKKIVYTSSAMVYGKNNRNIPFVENMIPKPHTLYGAIKFSIETIGRVAFPELINLRLFHVFGPGDLKNRLIPYVMNASKSSELLLTPCLQISDTIYVKDVAECIRQILLDDSIPPDNYNLGTGKPIQLRKIVELILKIRGIKIIPNYKRGYNKDIVKYSFADMCLLYKVCKWRPSYSLEEGICDMLSSEK